MRRRPLIFLALLGGGGVVGCSDDGKPAIGHVDPCSTAQGALLGCPPPTAGEEPYTPAEACFRLVRCGVIPLDRKDENGNHVEDWFACMDRLRRYHVDRLQYAMRCLSVAACQDLRDGLENPCLRYGDEP